LQATIRITAPVRTADRSGYDMRLRAWGSTEMRGAATQAPVLGHTPAGALWADDPDVAVARNGGDRVV